MYNLYIMKDILKYLFLCNSEVWIIILRMRANVNNAVHVQVEIVKLWDLQYNRTN